MAERFPYVRCSDYLEPIPLQHCPQHIADSVIVLCQYNSRHPCTSFPRSVNGYTLFTQNDNVSPESGRFKSAQL
jgi:hypothetical protein